MREGGGGTGVGVFVGRDRELAELRELVDGAAEGRGVVVVLTGAAGIGKTRLAEEAAASLRRTCSIVWATCGPPGGTPPFWPWAQVLADVLAADRAMVQDAEREWPEAVDLAAGRSVVTPSGGAAAAGPAEAEQARARLFEDVVGVLAAAARRRPLLAVVDDLHDADPASWMLLGHVAARLRALPLAVVATCRAGASRIADPARDHVFRLARILAVPPLGLDDVAALVEAASGEPVPAMVADALHRRTSGNPLLAHQVLAELRASGATQDPSAVASVVPDATRTLVADRLSRLTPTGREAISVASVVGTKFALDVVGDTVGADRSGLLDELAAAVAAGLLGPIGPTAGAFAHDIVRDAVFAAVPAGARPDLHRRVGEALERLRARGRPVEPAELARHFLEAGDDAAAGATSYAREAGDRAMAVLAYEDGASWYGKALVAGERAGADPIVRAALLIAEGEALDAAGDRVRARASYLAAAAESRGASRADLLAASALGLSGTVGFEVGLLDRQQIDLLGEALAALSDDSVATGPSTDARRASVMARLSVATSFLEDVERRRALTEEAVGLARRSGDDTVLVQALAAHCDAIAGPAFCATRSSLAQEAVDAGERLRQPQLELLGRRLLVVALLELGDMGGALRCMDGYAAISSALRQPLYAWYVPLWRGMRAFMEGRIGEARTLVGEVEAIGEQAASENAAVLATAFRWFLGVEVDGAASVEHLFAGTSLDAFPGVWPQVAVAFGEGECGRLDAARARLDAVAPRLVDAEMDSEWLPMMTQVAELIGLVGGHPSAGWVYEALVPYRDLFVVEGIGAVMRGSVARHLGILAAALGRRDEATASFDAAVGANEAIGATLLVARTMHDAGVFLGDADRLDEAGRRYAALGIRGRPRGPATESGHARSAQGNVFRREGEIWRLGFAGREVQLRDSKGLHDLSRLIREPGRPHPAAALAGAGAGGGRSAAAADGPHEAGDLGFVIDDQARSAYRARLLDLDAEIDDADRAADPERSARALAEKDALVAQLAAAFGLGGRPRRAGDPAERARQAVTARIRDAIARVEAVHPALGRHLRRSVRTGRVCVYEPESPTTWST